MNAATEITQQKLLPQAISLELAREKYAKGTEKDLSDFDLIPAVRRRIAVGLAVNETDPEYWEKVFFDAMTDGFIPAGRVSSAVGTALKVTLMNCFVQPIADQMTGNDEQGNPGITNALGESAETMRRGGGVGYDFSPIRPLNAFVKGTQSKASGPVSYMFMFDAMCATVASAGERRGAQMGVLRVDHPDIRRFINAKRTKGQLTRFNVSVGVTREFMDAVAANETFDLVHKARPMDTTNASQREDGMWVYEVIHAKELWLEIMKLTYDYAEPGVLFLTPMNTENTLYYAEQIDATNPCGEQPLPKYGCCDLGSVNLTKFVRDPFGSNAEFDFERFMAVCKVGVRILDNVLDLSYYPLLKQKEEAHSKRRIGLGYTGLGSTLVMMKSRYDRPEGRELARKITESMRDSSYEASVDLAVERGAFPLFDAEKHLDGNFIKRLPQHIRNRIQEHGIRNSHLLSLAPTGTISLTFGENVSGGVEPAFMFEYIRNVIQSDGSKKSEMVRDYAYHLYCFMQGGDQDVSTLPEYFVAAEEMSPMDHLEMVKAVAPYIDSAISKTINVATDYPFEKFQDIYLEAYEAGLKGITTYRYSDVRGAVLEAVDKPEKKELPQDLDTSADRKILLDVEMKPVLNSLRWPSRPALPEGNPSMTYMVDDAEAKVKFSVMVGHHENGSTTPFEVWVNGSEQPRGMGALAINLSTDMRSSDRQYLKMKLDALKSTKGTPVKLPFPPKGDAKTSPSAVSAMAGLVEYRCEQLGGFESEATPVVDAMFAKREPKTGPDGSMSWHADVKNVGTNDDFVLFVKELVLADGTHRPYSVWLAGDYPEALNGLSKALSLDMRIIDPAWIGKKLRGLIDFGEPNGDFLARVPGSPKQSSYPSTVAYVAALLIHRYNMLGILTPDGYPVHVMGVMEQEGEKASNSEEKSSLRAGAECPECKVNSYIQKDGCKFCTNCGHLGSCG